MLDLATLTGACMVALGTKIAGLFGNDDPFAQASGRLRQTGERVWRLPLDDDFQDALKSQVADLKNIGGKWGGAITAAKFLQQFVGETPGSTSTSPARAGPTPIAPPAMPAAPAASCAPWSPWSKPRRVRGDSRRGRGRRDRSRREGGSGLAKAVLKQAFDPAAVDVERLEDLEDLVHGQVVVDGPVQDVEVLLRRLSGDEDLVDEGGVVEGALEEAEIVVIELDPEGSALEVLEPAFAEEAVPVVADPARMAHSPRSRPAFSLSIHLCRWASTSPRSWTL